MTTTLQNANRDFEAAMHEVESNLEVRRLMFVLSNVLLPTCLVAAGDCLTGTDYPAHLRWLPEHILAVVGAVLLGAGVLVGMVLARCHFGLVVNSSKMSAVLEGDPRTRSLNWLGVTTNFVALTALSSGAGAALLAAGLELPWQAMAIGPAVAIALMMALAWNHARANKLSQRLRPDWQSGDVEPSLREQHARRSLDATTSDVSVIVVMAVALFAGAFSTMTKIGGIADLDLRPTAESLRNHGVTALAVFTLLSLALSARMVVRLRIALAQHSATLATLRGEPDDPWRFRLLERTYLLFAILHTLTITTAVILGWGLGGGMVAAICGAAVALVGLCWYPSALAAARPRNST